MSLRDLAEEVLRLYDTWPDQLLRSYGSSVAIKAPQTSPRIITLCGMGGSGVTGDYVWALGQAKGFNVPIFVHKADGLPSWVSKEDLVVAISYSGNTYETLSCAREAKARGATVLSVTSGGKLAQWAKDNGLPLATIDPGYLPRTALGMLTGAALGILRAAGVKLVDDSDINSAAEALRSTSRGEGEAIASALKGKDFYIVAGCGVFDIVAHRWRQEFSENAKVVTKTEFYPESAHNDLVSWQVLHNLRKGFVLIEGDGKVCSVLEDLLRQVYEDQKDTLVRVTPRGNGVLAQLLQGSLVGGYASTYLALLNNVNPKDTSITGRYKDALEKAGLV